MKWIVLVWGIACVAQASPELDRVFTHYETRELHLDQMASSAAVTHRLNIDIAGKSREMILEPVNLRSPSLAASHGWTYRGTVVGEPGSDVRLLVNDRLLLGYVRTADGFVFIDPVYIYARGEPPDHVVMYREEDVRPEFRSRCGGALKAPVGARSFAAVAVSAPTELRQVEVATDADAEFFQLHGDMSNAFIEGILNVVDGVYSSELGLSLEIVFQNVFTNAATQPYASTDASQLLTEFQDEWNAHRNGVARDVAHLFTGKSLDGSTAGIGFLDVVCDAPSFAYALTSSSALMSRVTAHEMGHNFGAKHDDEFVPPTAVCDGTGPLMCSAVQPRGPYDFSQRSIDDIAAHVAADGGCLAVLPTVELSVVISNVPNQVAVGDFITGIVLVSNAGPQEATGVTLTLSVSGAAIDSINSALGDCAPLFNTLSCGPAILPAGSTAESSIVIVPNRAGLVCLNASVVVDQHEMDTTNNRTQRCATAAVYDLAVVKLKAPRKVTLTGSVPCDRQVFRRHSKSQQRIHDHPGSRDIAQLGHGQCAVAGRLPGCRCNSATAQGCIPDYTCP